MSSDRMVRIAVIGAGVSGLSVVSCLKHQLPLSPLTASLRFKITIFADKILSETLSAGAGAIFRPDPNIGVSEELNDQWARQTFDCLTSIAKSSDSGAAGVFFCSGLHVSSRSSFSLNHLKPFCKDLRPLSPNEISLQLPEHEFKYGFSYTSIIVDPSRYLKWLMAQALSDCDLVIRKIASLEKEEILSDYDVIVNCSGFGSRLLSPDSRITSVRGQTVKVPAPWIKSFYWADGVYVYPSAEGIVTLGGIKDFDNENTDIDDEDSEWIWRKCVHLLPSLSACVSERSHWVGLRPLRQPIRVETEYLSNGRIVVHNYGHGGNGYTYSMGTAMTAADLVIQAVTQTARLKSKM